VKMKVVKLAGLPAPIADCAAGENDASLTVPIIKQQGKALAELFDGTGER